MGLLKNLTEKRRAKLIEKAAERVDPPEAVKELAMTQVGASVEQAKRDARLGLAAGRPHALVATDRQVYALPVAGVASLRAASAKFPLESVAIETDGRVVRLQGVDFHILDHAEEDAERLVAYVRESQGPSAGP